MKIEHYLSCRVKTGKQEYRAVPRQEALARGWDPDGPENCCFVDVPTEIEVSVYIKADENRDRDNILGAYVLCLAGFDFHVTHVTFHETFGSDLFRIEACLDYGISPEYHLKNLPGIVEKVFSLPWKDKKMVVENRFHKDRFTF